MDGSDASGSKRGTGNPAWQPQTQLVRGGLWRSAAEETSEALFLTSGYVYGSAEEAEAAFKGEKQRYIYSRYANPTVSMFEQRLRLLEGAEACVATASGMAAVYASLMCQLRAGDRVVASRALFGSCHFIVSELLPRYGIHTTLVDGTDLDQWRAALAPGVKAVFLETPSNPTLEIIDLPAVAEMTHAAGGMLIVDNVFATPLLQKPLQLGADVVVYSTTKHVDGQGRCLGGAIMCPQSLVDGGLKDFMRHTGPCMSPFNAWVLLKGLETMSLRVERQCRVAVEIADFLAGQPGVTRVSYPTLDSHPQAALARQQMSAGGTVVAFEIEGGKTAAFRFLNALRLIDISNNLGDSKSLITHPGTTTHQRLPAEERAKLGITDGFVRLSVGLEDSADIRDDLAAALKLAR